MTRKSIRTISVALSFLAVLLLSVTANGQAETKPADVLDPITKKTDLYPADADAKKEIEEALKTAAAEKKRVLLMFGGNWCYDCHVLDQALHQGVAGKILSESYVLVHVDIGEGDKNLDLVKQYKIPLEKGVPAMVVLTSDRRMLYWSGYGEFEAARKMLKEDVLAFLNHWKRAPSDAVPE